MAVWSQEKVDMLLSAVEKYGVDKWETVAEKLSAPDYKFVAAVCALLL